MSDPTQSSTPLSPPEVTTGSDGNHQPQARAADTATAAPTTPAAPEPGAASSTPNPTPSTPNPTPSAGQPSQGQPNEKAAGGVTTPPDPPAQSPATKPVRSRTTPILAIVIALLFLAASGMTGLYLSYRSDTDRTIANQMSQIASLEAQLKARDDEAAKIRQDLASAKNDLVTAQESAGNNKPCLEAAQNLAEAAKKNDSAASASAASTLIVTCSVATP